MNYFSAHPFISLITGFGLGLLVVSGFVFVLYRRWNALFGKRVRSSDDALAEILRRLRRAEKHIASLEPRTATLEDIGEIAIQKIGFMRFNPFEHTGGDQSFAIALLDREDNGLVLSSLYTREGVRVYAKKVQRGSSQHPLSEEEQKVLEQALNSGSKKQEA